MMPLSFYKHIRRLWLHAIVDLIGTVLLIVFLALSIELLIAKRSAGMLLVTAFIIVIFGTVMIINKKKLKIDFSNTPPYKIPITIDTIHGFAQSCGANSIDDSSAYVTFAYIQKIRVRMLIQYSSEFDHAIISKKRKQLNKVVNTKYSIKTSGSLYDSLASLRINLVICDKSSLAMIDWVNKKTTELLSRNESIVSVAVDLEEKTLLFPSHVSNLSIIELKKYVLAGEYLINCLQAGRRTGDGEMCVDSNPKR